MLRSPRKRRRSKQRPRRRRRARSPPPPELTGLRRARPGFVLLEVDGRPWRTVPDDVVVKCGLTAGTELGRPLLRLLRRELRQAEALRVAGRALARRDLSHRGLAQRLDRAQVAPSAGRSALAVLAEAGVIDDARVARERAASLADRGWGDRAIAARLEGEGIEEADALAAVAALAPEADRASLVAARLGDPRKAWRFLAGRGFDTDTIEGVLGALDEDEGGGLG